MFHMKKVLLAGLLLLLYTTTSQAALFTVLDSSDTTATNTLRWAISQANSTPGADDIRFGISSTFTIGSALPMITDQITISGGGNTLQATGNFSLITLGAGSEESILQDLILNNSAGNQGIGIRINSSSNIIQSCIIGTDWADSAVVGFATGIEIDGYGNLIGGDGSAGEGNIISSNSSIGITIDDGEGNSICGNIIGLNRTQDANLGNGTAGVAIFSCDENAVGLPISGWGNVVSGNNSYGIYASTDKTTIQNNVIGPNSANTATFSNGSGVYFSSSSLCQVGGDSSANEGNLISGNSYGINMSDSVNMTIYGNIIGLNAAQDTDLGNSDHGILLNDCDNNTIGSPITGWGNVICGNDYGIYLIESGNNVLQGNTIGLNTTGADYGNNGAGLYLYRAYSNLIGGNATAGAGNIISSNGSNGINIYNDCGGNSVAGNIIGLDSTQAIDRGNAGHGIDMGASGENYIGLPTTGWGNVIAGNDSYGIEIGSNGGNKVQNNFIGVSSSGTAFGQNQGIFVNSDNNLIGGDSTANEGNVISGNNTASTSSRGIWLAGGTGNRVCGNNIGLSPDQSTSLTNYRGIQIDSSGNTIGEPTAGWGNVISGNTYGLDLFSADNTVIQNNIIGLNTSGTLMANTYSGIDLSTSDNCLIGGRLNANHYERNVLSGNVYNNFILSQSHGNTISGNYFNTSLDGLSVIANALESETVYISSSGNNLIGGSNSDSANLRGNVINGLSKGILLRLEPSSGNTLTGNFINWLADGSIPSTGMTVGIEVSSDAYGNQIGIRGTGDGNMIAGIGVGIFIDGSGSFQNGIYSNTLTAMSVAGIGLMNNGNGNKAAPVITSINGSTISGNCSGSADFIEIFAAEPVSGNGGSLHFLGSTTAVGGAWSTTIPSFGGQYVCATASDFQHNTSPFSTNAINSGPTPTVSQTATITQTTTPTPIATSTTTFTITPTFTNTPFLTITPTSTATPTSTLTSTMTSSPTVTQTPDDQIDFKGKKSMAYPNPGKDRITFAINGDAGANVVITIYNLSGELVGKTETTLVSNQRVVWDCPDVAPGIYVARIQKDDSAWEKIKIAIVK